MLNCKGYSNQPTRVLSQWQKIFIFTHVTCSNSISKSQKFYSANTPNLQTSLRVGACLRSLQPVSSRCDGLPFCRVLCNSTTDVCALRCSHLPATPWASGLALISIQLPIWQDAAHNFTVAALDLNTSFARSAHLPCARGRAVSLRVDPEGINPGAQFT